MAIDSPVYLKGRHKGRLNQIELQVAGNFSKGDPHPLAKNVVYVRTDNSIANPQIWGTPKTLKKERARRLTHYKENRKHKNKVASAWKEANREKVIHTNRKTCERRTKAGYYRKHIQHIRDYYRYNKVTLEKGYAKKGYEKRMLKPANRVLNAYRIRVSMLLRGNKLYNSIQYLGCSGEELLDHLLSQAYDHPITGESMTTANRGFHGWHIDHIKPCSSFDLTKVGEQKKCFHYTNLQPLWQFDNISKHNKREWVHPTDR